MLARRFTIVCLLTTLFGMGLAFIVADNGQSGRYRDFDGIVHSSLR